MIQFGGMESLEIGVRERLRPCLINANEAAAIPSIQLRPATDKQASEWEGEEEL